jgi:hypothetical protein
MLGLKSISQITDPLDLLSSPSLHNESSALPCPRPIPDDRTHLPSLHSAPTLLRTYYCIPIIWSALTDLRTYASINGTPPSEKDLFSNTLSMSFSLDSYSFSCSPQCTAKLKLLLARTQSSNSIMCTREHVSFHPGTLLHSTIAIIASLLTFVSVCQGRV